MSNAREANLFFRKTGNNGTPIIIIHGLYGSSDNWMTVARKLSETNLIYCIDQRNHGRSPHFSEHNYNAMSNDLLHFMEEQQIGKAIIMGHSMGGKTAMRFAADHPELVEQLLVIDICPKDYMALGENSQIHQHQHILETLLELQHLRHSFSSRQEVVDFLELKLDSKELVLFLSKSIPWDREKSTFDLRLNVEVLYDNLDEIINGVNELNLIGKTENLPFKVDFIRGLNSPYIGNNDLPLIKRLYPSAQIIDIPHAGHWLHAEQPSLFLDAVKTLIS
ncbi:MAG: alpha/beta fold hydrolase [Mangrovibacterium sp.]